MKYSETVSMIDTSTPEKHLEGLTYVMVTMGIAKRHDMFKIAWEQACELVNWDKAKMEEVEARIQEIAQNFVDAKPQLRGKKGKF